MTEQKVKDITPPEAWEILQENPQATLFDVRTRMEFDYVGHPANAVNVPWQEAPDWSINTGFAGMIRQALITRQGSDKDVEALPVLTICRSGKRSLAAAQELVRHGFRQVYNIEQGFEGDRDGAQHRSTINGWRYHNLPWEQS